MAITSTSEEDFNKKAKQPWIESGNKADTKPVSHAMGFTLSQGKVKNFTDPPG